MQAENDLCSLIGLEFKMKTKFKTLFQNTTRMWNVVRSSKDTDLGVPSDFQGS